MVESASSSTSASTGLTPRRLASPCVSMLLPPECKVPRLRDWLADLKLEEYYEQVNAWCFEEGATSLQEVAESVDELLEVIGFKRIERKRVEKWAAAVLSQASGDGSPVEATAVLEAWAELQEELGLAQRGPPLT